MRVRNAKPGFQGANNPERRLPAALPEKAGLIPEPPLYNRRLSRSAGFCCISTNLQRDTRTDCNPKPDPGSRIAAERTRIVADEFGEIVGDARAGRAVGAVRVGDPLRIRVSDQDLPRVCSNRSRAATVNARMLATRS